MITLRQSIRNKIKEDRILFMQVQSALGVTENSLYRMLKGNSKRLTELNAINTIVHYTELPLNKLVLGDLTKELQ